MRTASFIAAVLVTAVLFGTGVFLCVSLLQSGTFLRAVMTPGTALVIAEVTSLVGGFVAIIAGLRSRSPSEGESRFILRRPLRRG